MTVSLSPNPVFQWLQNGVAGAGDQLFTYQAGTMIKQATWTDSSQIAPNTNPIILDANGKCSIWIDETFTYKYVLAPSTDTDPPTNPIWTVDNVSALKGPIGPQGPQGLTGPAGVQGPPGPPNAIVLSLAAVYPSNAALYTPQGLTGAVVTNTGSGGGTANTVGNVATITSTGYNVAPSVLYDTDSSAHPINVRINFAGYYIGSGTPTLPTVTALPNAATGAVVTLSQGALYAAGQDYFVDLVNGFWTPYLPGTPPTPDPNRFPVPASDYYTASTTLGAASGAFLAPASGIHNLFNNSTAYVGTATSTMVLSTLEGNFSGLGDGNLTLVIVTGIPNPSGAWTATYVSSSTLNIPSEAISGYTKVPIGGTITLLAGQSLLVCSSATGPGIRYLDASGPHWWYNSGTFSSGTFSMANVIANTTAAIRLSGTDNAVGVPRSALADGALLTTLSNDLPGTTAAAQTSRNVTRTYGYIGPLTVTQYGTVGFPGSYTTILGVAPNGGTLNSLSMVLGAFTSGSISLEIWRGSLPNLYQVSKTAGLPSPATGATVVTWTASDFGTINLLPGDFICLNNGTPNSSYLINSSLNPSGVPSGVGQPTTIYYTANAASGAAIFTPYLAGVCLVRFAIVETSFQSDSDTLAAGGFPNLNLLNPPAPQAMCIILPSFGDSLDVGVSDRTFMTAVIPAGAGYAYNSSGAIVPLISDTIPQAPGSWVTAGCTIMPAAMDRLYAKTGSPVIGLVWGYPGSTYGGTGGTTGAWKPAGFVDSAIAQVNALIANLEAAKIPWMLGPTIMLVSGHNDGVQIDNGYQTEAQLKLDMAATFARIRDPVHGFYSRATRTSPSAQGMIIVSYGYPVSGDTTGHQKMREAFHEVAMEDVNSRIVTTGLNAATWPNGISADGIHWRGPVYEAVGYAVGDIAATMMGRG